MKVDSTTWVKVGAASDFEIGMIKEVAAGPENILIYRDEKQWYAFEQKCPHQKNNLNNAKIEGKVLTCAYHSAKFDISTGEVVSDAGYPGLANLRIFPIRVEGDNVYVNHQPMTIDSWDKGLEY